MSVLGKIFKWFSICKKNIVITEETVLEIYFALFLITAKCVITYCYSNQNKVNQKVKLI